MIRKVITVSLAALIAVSAYADEGMWLVNAINRALEAKMQERGLKLSARDIYDADAEGASLSDAILSLDFACSGSVISEEGLVITNHHCAYSDVFSLSTPEHNYLEDGYWAFYQKDEIPIPGKGVQFLKRVIDVTEEANGLIAEYKANGLPLGSRKLSHLIETKYHEETGYEASLYNMWSGSKYYLALYLEYKDVRLVAAPPVSIAAFGGDIDNWEWPQHKGDFAMYRIYTAPDGSPAKYSENNVPLKSARKLEISLAGLKEGDFTMILGYPGKTSRYSSAPKVTSLVNVSLPAASIVRKTNMDITKRWMDTDPQTRLLYSDWFFSLSNVQELEEGEVECCNRFEVVEKMRKADEELQEWIVADPVRKEKWGELLSELDRKWSSLDGFLKSETYARETLIRSSRLGIVCIRLHSNLKNAKNRLVSDIEELDLRVEKDIYRSSLRLFFENVDSKYWSEFHTALRQQYGNDYESMCNDTWAASLFESKDKIKAFADSDASISDDPVYEFYTNLEMSELNKIEVSLDPTPNRTELGHEYTKALYQMREEKGIPQYPDANSSMRLTYGTVGGIEPFDAVVCSWASTSKGILEKYDPEDYDFSLKPEWKEIVGTYDGTVNFITDNDITGGNSGSAVLNAEGQLVGLAFDGNKESLASDVYYTPGYNKCVCVDIRYVVFILRAHHFDRILSEIALG